MAFDPNKRNTPSKLSQEEEDDILNMIGDDEGVPSDDREEIKNKVKTENSVKRTPKNNKEIEKEKKTVIACIAVCLAVVLIGAVVFFINNKNKNAQLQQYQQSLENAKKENEKNKNKDDIKAGTPDLYGNSTGENKSDITPADNITTNLNGEAVNPNYNVVNIETVTDYINYTKYRAVTSEGMEFYWLEVVYKQKTYKCQVKYNIYSKLDTQGITVVDMEVLTLDDGSEIISYMNVRKDADTLLNNK